jgi:hypothetical protein
VGGMSEGTMDGMVLPPDCSSDYRNLSMCVRQTSCPCDKIPDINNLREDGFILAHGFGGFSP